MTQTIGYLVLDIFVYISDVYFLMRKCIQPLSKLHDRWRVDKSTNGRFDCNIKAQCITE